MPNRRNRTNCRANTRAGTFSKRPDRAAAGGGWFSYVLKLPATRPAKLVCTYWGSDAGRRTFDILADGARIATQRLDHNQPGEFFDATYELAPELVAGKSQITIKFQCMRARSPGGCTA